MGITSTSIYLAALLFLLFDRIVLIESTDKDICPGICRCKPKQGSARCLNEQEQLSVIPKLPTYVRKLYLDSNFIFQITNSTFEQPSLRDLTLLSMKGCKIRHLEEKSFKKLEHLNSLYLGSNIFLNISSLRLALSSLQKKEMKKMSFNFMRWTSYHVSTRIFEYLENYTVRYLSLLGNNLESWSNSASVGLNNVLKLSLSKNKINTCEHLFSLVSLEHLDLSNNMLMKCDIQMLPKSLLSLQLSNNVFKKFPKFCSNDGSTALLPRLEKLKIAYNKIITITNMLLPCFPSLKYLALNGNDIRRIPEGTFSKMSNLLVLQMERMKNGVKYISLNAFRIPSLKKLYFKQNGYYFDLKATIQPVTFGACRKLETLDLSGNYMPKTNKYLRQLLHGLNKLKTIRLVSVGWLSIPDSFFKIFPNAEKIYLSQNSISQLTKNIFPDKMKLRELYLDRNSFSSLGPGAFPDSFWKYVKRIDISGNPYACNCDLLWFRNKLSSSSVIFHQYPRDYICTSPTELRGKEVSKFNATEEDCMSNSLVLTTLVSSGSVCVFAGLIVFCLYRARWHIRYLLYLLRYRRDDPTRSYGDRDDYKYDAFISYAAEDGDFVHTILLNKLENEQGFRLCIHARDFEVGRIIADNIAENMSSSRQALLVMSKNFQKSKWCRFEQLIALDRWLNNESGAIVIIMLGEFNSRDIDKDTKTLLKTTTYAQWTSNKIGQEVFWDQLLSSLKR